MGCGVFVRNKVVISGNEGGVSSAEIPTSHHFSRGMIMPGGWHAHVNLTDMLASQVAVTACWPSFLLLATDTAESGP